MDADELLAALRDFIRAEIRDARPDSDLVDALNLHDESERMRLILDRLLNLNREG